MPKSSDGRAGARGKKGRGSTPGSARTGRGAQPASGKKQRWSTEQREARGLVPERPRGAKGGRGRVEPGRPNWEPRRREDADAALRDAAAAADVRRGRPDRSAGSRASAPRSTRTSPSRGTSAGDPRPRRSNSAAAEEKGRRSPRYERDREPRAEGAREYRDAREHRVERAPRADRERSADGQRRRDDRERERPVRDRPRRDDRGREHEARDRPSRDRSPRERDPRDRPYRETREREPRGRSGEHEGRGGETRAEPREDVVLDRLEASALQSPDVEGVSFSDLGLGPNIVRALGELGAASPFPIQAATIPDALAGRDVLGRGRTGSGKTIAFAAPLVERILQGRADRSAGERRRPGRPPEALVLAPTRELALQIDRTVQPIARSVGLFTTQVYGGVPYARQYGALSRGVDIVIGTPGRVEDLVEQGRLDLSAVTVTVLDEADHMTDLGFLEPVQRILRRTADDGQRMLFSATLDTAVASLVDEFLDDPAVHEVAGEQAASAAIAHHVLLLDQRDKLDVLTELAEGPAPKLVFVRTRSFAEDVTDLLDDHGIDAVPLHGDLTQPRRTRNLERFSRGRASVLVATDVAARGIHIDDVALIVQADAPDEYKTYLHRSGRTGRAGKSGIVVTLVARNRRRRVEELLSRAGIEAEWASVRPGDATIAALVAEANDTGAADGAATP